MCYCCSNFVVCFLLLFVTTSLSLCTAAARAEYPFLSVCAVFSCFQTMVILLPVFGIFLTCEQLLMHAIVHRGLYGHRETVCTGSRLGEENKNKKQQQQQNLPHQGLEPASVLRWLFIGTLCQLSYSRPLPFFQLNALGVIRYRCKTVSVLFNTF